MDPQGTFIHNIDIKLAEGPALNLIFLLIKNDIIYIMGILHEGAERKSVLHEAGQTW